MFKYFAQDTYCLNFVHTQTFVHDILVIFLQKTCERFHHNCFKYIHTFIKKNNENKSINHQFSPNIHF